MTTKSKLAITLSRLLVFDHAKPLLEQYPTDSEIAAEILWFALMKGDIKDKIVADLGAGTGILGIGALLLGAKQVFFVEKDTDALEILKSNTKDYSNCTVVDSDISNFNMHVDTIVMNPPFGTRKKHADSVFLKKAFLLADTIYSLHKTSTSRFIMKLADSCKFEAGDRMDFSFPLKMSQIQHKKRIHRIEVSCFRFSKIYK